MRRWMGVGRAPRLLLWVAILAAGCGADPAGPEGPDDGDRGVLLIGNSLTYFNDLPAILEVLLETGTGEEFFVASETGANFGLPDHWAAGRAQQRIRGGGWEVVVLQQGPSATEGRPYLLEYAEIFAEEIRAVGALPAMYMVWPSASRSFDFDGVLDSYRTAAENVDGLFFPAGEAWRVAWERDADLGFYGPDGFHPSWLGTYVAALVMYEQISGLDPRELPASIPGLDEPPDLDEDLAVTLRDAAREANARHRRVPGG